MSELITLEVTTYVFGLGSERKTPPVYVRLAERSLPAKALIVEHVRAEVTRAKQCRESSLALHYLLDDDLRVPPAGAAPLDVDVETSRALAGLAERRYILVVDGVAVSNPDEQLTLTERSLVSFMRLLPLVGG